MSFPRTKRGPDDVVPYAIVAGLVFVYLVLRAVLVPLVHDEANTFFHYVHNGTWVPFLAHWDAGNHVLAMAMGRVTTTLFGPGALALRSFSLLCYLLYAWYVWRVGGALKDRLVRWCCWLALLGTPFVLEFFALFRGYGPSIALLMMGMYHLAGAWRTGGTRDAVLAPIALGAAVVANLSILPMWAAGMALLAVLALGSAQGHATRIAGLVLGALPGLVMAAFALGLRDRGLLYHGNMQGVFNGSTASLVEVVLGTQYMLPRMIVAMLFVAVLFITQRTWRTGERDAGTMLLVVATGLLLAELIARMLLGGLLEVLYPTYRAAMHWVPPFVLGLGLALDRSTATAPYRRWAALLLLALPLRSAHVANTRLVTNWYAEYLPATLYHAVMDKQSQAPRNLALSMPGTLGPIWDHYNLTQGDVAFFPDLKDDPDTLADLIIGPAWRLPGDGYGTVLKARVGGHHLVERNDQVSWRPFADTAWKAPVGDAEFRNVLEASVRGQQGRPVMISFTGVLSGPAEERGELFLVTELRKAEGGHIHYRALPLHRSWPHGRRWPLRMVQVLPPLPPEADRLVFYFWAPGGRRHAIDGLMAAFLEPVALSTLNE
jgi:hypothetical protein